MSTMPTITLTNNDRESRSFLFSEACNDYLSGYVEVSVILYHGERYWRFKNSNSGHKYARKMSAKGIMTNAGLSETKYHFNCRPCLRVKGGLAVKY